MFKYIYIYYIRPKILEVIWIGSGGSVFVNMMVSIAKPNTLKGFMFTKGMGLNFFIKGIIKKIVGY